MTESDRRSPRRGDVFWVDFNPARGVEQAGRRPAVVVQNDRGNANSSYTVVAAISSALLSRKYPFTVLLQPGDANVSQACHVNCAQLITIDQNRLERYIGSLGGALMLEIDDALRYELDL